MSSVRAVLSCRSVSITSSSKIGYLRGLVTANAPIVEQNNDRPIGYPWRIASAICVQRFPTLAREKTPFELEYQTLREQIYVENSRLSDFELEEREILRKKRAREKKAMEEDIDVSQLAEEDTEFEDLLEARQNDFKSFSGSSTETEADRNGDFKTINRRLGSMLYLLVKKPRTDYSWQMPQGRLEKGQNLIEAAESKLLETCGNLRVNFLSNSPSAFLSFKHASLPGDPQGITGTKVFFFKAQLLSGTVDISQSKLEDYAWVTREEMKDYVSPDYYKAVSSAVVD